MRYRLPPLNSLRAFEAAARHGNISHAAAELCVTPSAVSRHVAILEEHLGCALLVRQHRGVTLTEGGDRYLGEIGAAFERIDRAGRRLGRNRTTTTLVVRLFTTFMTDWLSARLHGFRMAHPEIGLNLASSLQAVDFDTHEIDLGMIHGPGDWPSLHADMLFRPQFTPVCSPALLEAGDGLRDPQDLRDHNLLYSPLQAPQWQAWLREAGVEGIDSGEGLRFESSSHAYHTARQGAGVALGQTFYLVDDLATGRLVAPFNLQLKSDFFYCLACAKGRKDEPAIATFRAWLLSEVAKTETEVRKLFP